MTALLERPWRLVAMLAVAGLVGLVVLYGVIKITQRNRDAIRVSCIVLSNKIVESNPRPDAEGKLPPTAELQALYLSALRPLLSSEQRERERELRAQIAKQGGPIPLPQCERIAKHPERVKLTTVKP